MILSRGGFNAEGAEGAEFFSMPQLRCVVGAFSGFPLARE